MAKIMEIRDRVSKLIADQEKAMAHDHEAVRLCKLAAEQGNTDGQVDLGVFYSQGRGGLAKDDREAARLFKLAADQGNSAGESLLGLFYEQGRGGLPKDDREAARLYARVYKRGADQGWAWAQTQLGLLYEQGRGGLVKDDREAARLYRLAADRGNAEAQGALTRLGRQQEEEKRQKKAAVRERQADSNKIADKETEDQRVIRIAGTTTAAAPRQPVPADFGIAEKDLNHLPKLVFGLPVDNVFGLGLFIATTILIAVIPLNLLVRGDWSHGNSAILLIAVPFLMLGAAFTAPCFRVLGVIEKQIRSAISPTFRRASQYRSAMDGYRTNVAEYEHWIAAQEEAYWRGLSGVAFENELARLFRGLGYQVSETPRTGDGGIDLILHKDNRVTVVQCKAHDKKIPIGVARELIASMQDFNAHDAIIACLEGVTSPVQRYIATKPIRVIDVREILSLQRSLPRERG